MTSISGHNRIRWIRFTLQLNQKTVLTSAAHIQLNQKTNQNMKQKFSDSE